MRSTISNRGSFLVTKALFFISVFILVTLSFFPSILDLIDETNHADDITIADHMSDVILQNRDNIFNTTYDTYDIRQLIATSKTFSFENLNYSEHYGLFYANQLDRAVVLPNESLESCLKNIFLSYGLTYDDWDTTFYHSPEEFLGRDIFYIPNEQSILSDTIHFIRSYPQSPRKPYESYMENLNALNSGLINKLFYSKAIAKEIKISQDLLQFYDPSKTLWVDDSSWYTEATSPDTIHTILFKQGMTNIPSFNLSSSIDFSNSKISLEEVILPRTITNIEYDAFSKTYFNINQLSIKSVIDLYIQPGSVSGFKTFFRNIDFFKMDLMNLSKYIEFETDDHNQATFSLGEYSKVIADHGITAYKLEQLDDIIVVYLYTFDFLVAYATNAYVIDYYLEESAPYPYVTLIQTNETYRDPITPKHPTRDFSGWYNQEEILMIAGESTLISQHTILFAKES
jgi:hypothetical protein